MNQIVRWETLKRKLMIDDETDNAFIAKRQKTKRQKTKFVFRGHIVAVACGIFFVSAAWSHTILELVNRIQRQFGGFIVIREAFALTLTHFERHRCALAAIARSDTFWAFVELVIAIESN